MNEPDEFKVSRYAESIRQIGLESGVNLGLNALESVLGCLSEMPDSKRQVRQRAFVQHEIELLKRRGGIE